MDWRLGHAFYSLALHHHWLGAAFFDVERASIPVMVVLTASLWLFGRRMASASGFAASAVAFVLNTIVHTVYDRPRPYEAHRFSHPWSKSTDASFPSDHTSLSFAIAFAVLVFDTTAGLVFIVVAALIAIGRLFIAAHYPGDIAAGIVVGAGSAWIVTRPLRPFVERVVRTTSRVLRLR